MTNTLYRFAITILILVSTQQAVLADALTIKPYAQWTFDTPIEQIIYRPTGTGFPIKLILTEAEITLYDSTGNHIRAVSRAAADKFVINHNQSGFMLVQVNPSNLIDHEEILYSFQVYDIQGRPEYTLVQRVTNPDGILNYQFTSEKSILLTEKGRPYIIELYNENTLLEVPSCQSGSSKSDEVFTLATKLKHANEMITAVSCSANIDSSSTEIRLWNHDQGLGSPVFQSGRLIELNPLPKTDYYFMELEKGTGTSLSLFNRTQLIGTFPWQSWKIQKVNQQFAFIISEKDFNIVNLGDGSIVSTYHPIDLSSISDAIFLPEWGIYLYLRYEPYFRENGRQAFRNFQLEGVDKTGRIIHRSSFGTWTYSLPKIASIGKDLFGIHIHNAVLMYGIKLERD